MMLQLSWLAFHRRLSEVLNIASWDSFPHNLLLANQNLRNKGVLEVNLDDCNGVLLA
jgi:hypothetical protein